ncbi:MAG: energy-coupling factor transporter ATPase [Clostridia bacterium]|nr:energy-coupling factor transporter ATPase [Clostridia bacterium]
MGSYQIENLSFTYPNRENKAVNDISFAINQGEFITLCGQSGCGKTTLLRLLKTSLAPYGTLSGSIYFDGKILSEIHAKEQAAKIGFVMQSPDNQIVTDKVWHELAFGLESLGYSTPEIRTRVAEMASFFGMQTWFHKKITELSGGQKQLLNLASVMVMQPTVILLDEPTSQIDPIAAQEFFNTLEKINRELGITVIVSEHRLEEAFPISDRVMVMDNGRLIANDTPQKVGAILQSKNHAMYAALPTPMRVYGAIENHSAYPLTVRDGKAWLAKYAESHILHTDVIPKADHHSADAKTIIEVKDAYFRYEKDLPDVIKGLHIKINKGELFAIVGGNGTGKTTTLSLISGLIKPYRGEIRIYGENIAKVKNLYTGIFGVLPQNPQTVFVKKTVYLDLMEILSERKIPKEEKENKVKKIAALCRIENLLDSHPYDLSGGEQQRAALAKVLLMSPRILLLDEPTKGLDAHFKQIFADIIRNLKTNGVTIVMVSHDIEFCAEYADRCAMFFDGNITSVGDPRAFFSGKNFYTTSANRMARARLPEAVLAEDIILACGGVVPKKTHTLPSQMTLPKNEEEKRPQQKKKTSLRMVLGSVFVLLFILTCMLQIADTTPFAIHLDTSILQLIYIAEMAGVLGCFIPQKGFSIDSFGQPQTKRKLSKRTVAAALFILLAIPLTIYIGIFYLQDRKYYFISMLILLETMLPFCMAFEARRPKARELVIISVLCAIAVAGRTAFFMIPQFKPVVALIIIAGVCFGGETGFLVGAVTGFVSNFFFGQGPWTPWHMFAFGIIGLIAGILFQKGLLRKTKASLCVFGAVVTFVIYGGIMNASTVMMLQDKLNFAMMKAAYIAGAPFDLVHAASTAFFLWFIAGPMIEKLDRIKVKYGWMERESKQADEEITNGSNV